MSTTTSIICPHCRKTLRGKPELTGKTIRCPACQQPFVYQPTVQASGDDLVAMLSAEPPKPQAQSPNQPETIPLQSGGDEILTVIPVKAKDAPPAEEEEKAYGVTDLDLTPRCPNCANALESEDAVVCLYCGYNLVTRRWATTKKVYANTLGDHILWLLPGLAALFTICLLIIFCLFYCLVLPGWAGGWLVLFVGEQVRIWVVIFVLSCIWTLGFFGYKRLIIEPTPPEVEK